MPCSSRIGSTLLIHPCSTLPCPRSQLHCLVRLVRLLLPLVSFAPRGGRACWHMLLSLFLSPQRRSLMTSPGNSAGLFDSGLLAEVVAQVHSSSQISSNLALSRSLHRGRPSQTPSSSPLTGPRLPSFSRGRPYGKRSASSPRSGSRKRFRGGKGAAPSSGPLGFRR